MDESTNLERAAVHQSRRLPVIWAIPIIAIAIGAWLAWETLSKEGPTIVKRAYQRTAASAGADRTSPSYSWFWIGIGIF